MIESHINLLGQTATHKITGCTGAITSVCFDLYGCTQAVLCPKVDDNGKSDGGGWFDANRLEIDDSITRVMPVPNFGRGTAVIEDKGPADKPLR